MTFARFPRSTPLYDSHRRAVLFAAIIGSETIACAVSTEALADHFDGDAQTPTLAFSQNRPLIEAAADKLIAARRFESDGSILVKTEDL